MNRMHTTEGFLSSWSGEGTRRTIGSDDRSTVPEQIEKQLEISDGPSGRWTPGCLKVDLDLVQKYNVPGPRYTSYPPATHFTDGVPISQLLERICANNETERDLSLYFHLPFCQSLCWFCGCTTVITTDQRPPFWRRRRSARWAN